jgi:hypothetical protein
MCRYPFFILAIHGCSELRTSLQFQEAIANCARCCRTIERKHLAQKVRDFLDKLRNGGGSERGPLEAR